MPEIGASKARARLPYLLRRVQAGERFVITKHNRPMAELVPLQPHDPNEVRTAIANLKAFQKTHSLAGLSIRQMIAEGRGDDGC